MSAGNFGFSGGFWRGARRQKSVEGGVLGRKMRASDSLEIGRGQAFDRRKIAFGEIEIVGSKPTSAARDTPSMDKPRNSAMASISRP